jgi:polyphosphate kinase 2 (PPK2 family)
LTASEFSPCIACQAPAIPTCPALGSSCRFNARLNDPAKQWKLSGMDLEARRRWVDYAEAKDDMFSYTDTRESPWYVVEADDSERCG